MKAPVVIRQDDAKSELVYDADIRQALHQEGSWYLIPQRYCFFYFGTTPFYSHVFHVCSKSWEVENNPGNPPTSQMIVAPYTCHRIWQEDMTEPCEHCGETAPDGLIALWTLHNWDYLSLNDS